MEKIIIIRYGEIFLKGNNKYFFESVLRRNIEKSLKDIDCIITKAQNRLFIEKYDEKDEKMLFTKLKRIFGIHSLSSAVKVKTNLEKIKEVASEISPKIGRFRVSVNRADDSIRERSMDIARDIGGFILSKSENLTVDLFNYDFEVRVDIRENGYSFIYFDKVMGAGGLPVGCSGKAMLMLSGGIDSPVAGYMMAKRGIKLYAVHFYSFPYTSEAAKQKVFDLAKIISNYTTEIEVSVVPFTKVQQAIHEQCPAEFMITIMRRIMVRIAETLAKQKGAEALITGESLGQVASQTMQSLHTTNFVADIPIFRPLIGFDKSEIIDIAKRIDTYDTSILPYEDCCTVFLPKNPVIRPKLNIIEKAENALSLDELIDYAVKRTETVIC